MSFLLDTDVCSAYMRGDGAVTNRFVQYGGRLHISAITLGELCTWISRAATARRRAVDLEDMLQALVVIHVDEPIARRFGTIRARLKDAGTPMPDLDLLIATTAIVHDLTLVTHNRRDYQSVPGLHMEDWLSD